MIKFLVLVLVLGGGFYYLTRSASLDSGMELVARHKDATWAPRANYAIALVYHQRGEYPKSQEAFTQLLTDYPTCQFAASGLFYLEDAAEYNHDWDTVKSALDRYASDYPDGPDFMLMQKRREVLRAQHGF